MDLVENLTLLENALGSSQWGNDHQAAALLLDVLADILDAVPPKAHIGRILGRLMADLPVQAASGSQVGKKSAEAAFVPLDGARRPVLAAPGEGFVNYGSEGKRCFPEGNCRMMVDACQLEGWRRPDHGMDGGQVIDGRAAAREDVAAHLRFFWRRSTMNKLRKGWQGEFGVSGWSG